MNRIYTTSLNGTLIAGDDKKVALSIYQPDGFYLKSVFFDIGFSINVAPFNNIPLEQNLSQDYFLEISDLVGTKPISGMFKVEAPGLALMGNGAIIHLVRPQQIKFDSWLINTSLLFTLNIINKEPVNATTYFGAIVVEIDVINPGNK